MKLCLVYHALKQMKLSVVGNDPLTIISYFSTQVRSQVAYGSIGEVKRFEAMVGVKAMAGAA